MADRLRFHPKLANDLNKAIGWYDDISGGLGNRIRNQIDARFDEINARPVSFPTAFDDV